MYPAAVHGCLERICPVAKQRRCEFGQVGYVLAPYLMFASMDGTSVVRGREVEVDVSPSDIFENLQFGAMGYFGTRKGNWGFGVEVRSSE